METDDVPVDRREMRVDEGAWKTSVGEGVRTGWWVSRPEDGNSTSTRITTNKTDFFFFPKS